MTRRTLDKRLDDLEDAFGDRVDPTPSNAPIPEEFARVVPPWRWNNPLGEIIHLAKKAEYGHFESAAAREWFKEHADADVYDPADSDADA